MGKRRPGRPLKSLLDGHNCEAETGCSLFSLRGQEEEEISGEENVEQKILK
jgi:hypothetical protein